MGNTAITAYFNCINNNYDTLQDTCRKVTERNREVFSEDTFSDTIIHIYNIIEKKGQLNDMSCAGITNYFVRSYVNNLRMEKRYAYSKKRNLNIEPKDFKEAHEKSLTDVRDKIVKDLFEDYSVIAIIKRVEENFDAEHLYLFKLKFLSKMTYKQIYQKTKLPKCRDKILEVKRWLKENCSREILKKEFNDTFDDLLN